MKNLIVYVENKVLDDPAISGDENFGVITKKFCTFREGMEIPWNSKCKKYVYIFCVRDVNGSFSVYSSDLDDISNRVDFIICLGGDGTLLYASSLFQVFSRMFPLSRFSLVFFPFTAVTLGSPPLFFHL